MAQRDVDMVPQVPRAGGPGGWRRCHDAEHLPWTARTYHPPAVPPVTRLAGHAARGLAGIAAQAAVQVVVPAAAGVWPGPARGGGRSTRPRLSAYRAVYSVVYMKVKVETKNFLINTRAVTFTRRRLSTR
ncbi:conserved hypothetical protein [Parafrankia sp. Ea1.12]|nr:conserved hypothetical protein [Parafrankia sp. Ea1.12]